MSTINELIVDISFLHLLYYFQKMKEVLFMEQVISKKAFSTKDIVFMGIFVSLIAVCSWISIPSTVPFTLQTLGVFLTVFVLGGKRGTLAITTYLILGAVGVPVFANFTGGLGKILGLTGGYLVGFIATALIMWFFEVVFGRKIFTLILSAVLGLLACYTLGTAWFMYVYSNTKESISLSTTLSWCVYPFIIPDLVKLILALMIGERLYKVFQSLNR